jgi:hypothetical protein
MCNVKSEFISEIIGANEIISKSIYLSGLVAAVAFFRNPNTIPFCLTTDLLLNVLFSWLLVHLPFTFFLDVLIISKSFRKYLSNTPGEYEVKELHKNNHIGHCTRASKSTNAIVRIFMLRNRVTFSINRNIRTAALLYNLETQFVSII